MSLQSDDVHLLRRLSEIAAERPRFGYSRLGILLRRERLDVNHDRILRLHRDARFALQRKRRRRVSLANRAGEFVGTRSSECWSTCSLSDTFADGHATRVFAAVDDPSKVSPVVEADLSQPALRVTRTLDCTIEVHGSPTAARSLRARRSTRGRTGTASNTSSSAPASQSRTRPGRAILLLLATRAPMCSDRCGSALRRLARRSFELSPICGAVRHDNLGFLRKLALIQPPQVSVVNALYASDRGQSAGDVLEPRVSRDPLQQDAGSIAHHCRALEECVDGIEHRRCQVGPVPVATQGEHTCGNHRFGSKRFRSVVQERRFSIPNTATSPLVVGSATSAARLRRPRVSSLRAPSRRGRDPALREWLGSRARRCRG